MNNSTLNISCLNNPNCSESDVAVLYQANGVLHILLVILPVLVMGPFILGIFFSNKKLRDSISVLHICTVMLCIIGPLTYGLLMDISLITNLKMFGSCDSRSTGIFWILFGTIQCQQYVTNALVSIVSYTIIKWKKKISVSAVLGIFFSFLIVIFLFHLLYLVWPGEDNVRGSLCAHSIQDKPYLYAVIALLQIGFLAIPPFVLVIVFSLSIVVYVKSNTIENENLKRTLKFVLISTSILCLRLLPILILIVGVIISIRSPFSLSLACTWYGVYSVELANPLYLFLTVLLQKTVRETFLRKIGRIFQCKKKTKSSCSK